MNFFCVNIMQVQKSSVSQLHNLECATTEQDRVHSCAGGASMVLHVLVCSNRQDQYILFMWKKFLIICVHMYNIKLLNKTEI